MPPCCVVPLCSTRMSGHRFPKDPLLKKKWLIAIRRLGFTPTEYSRICKKHFNESDYRMPLDSVCKQPKPLLKAGAVPSVFAWTKASSEAAVNRVARAEKRNSKSNSKTCSEPVVETAMNCDLVLSNTEITVTVECALKEKAIQCEFLHVDVTEKATVTDPISSHKCSCGQFTIDNFKTTERNAELQFYSGFEDYEHFMLVFIILGPQVNYLRYYPNMTESSHLLAPADEFFLTVIKLRRGMTNKELAYRFHISFSAVSSIVITWINFLYMQFKEINLWPSQGTLKNNMKFKGKDYTSTIIIDCTEVKTVKPRNPTAQQETFSSYKNCNTLKVLVGISPTGSIMFVSDAYGGSASDREIFEQSGLIDLLERKDCVLADRGFQIQDLLCHKDIVVRTPAFLNKNAYQLEPEQISYSKCISSNRIHVERVIGLGKTYKILTIPLSTGLFPLGNRIIFVCFMMANFRMNIM